MLLASLNVLGVGYFLQQHPQLLNSTIICYGKVSGIGRLVSGLFSECLFASDVNVHMYCKGKGGLCDSKMKILFETAFLLIPRSRIQCPFVDKC